MHQKSRLLLLNLYLAQNDSMMLRRDFHVHENWDVAGPTVPSLVVIVATSSNLLLLLRSPSSPGSIAEVIHE